MMFGTREPFQYETCPRCGTIQISRIPKDLGRFYPGSYYSLASNQTFPEPSRIRGFFAQAILILPGSRFLTRALRFKYPFLSWASIAGTSVSSSYLDVGCGNGRLLGRMRKTGFGNLTGVDPFAPKDVNLPGLRIRRAELKAVDGAFDLIILSHVLEHLPDPVGALKEARARLTPSGVVLARVPIAGSALNRQFGPDWFNLDPPRHLFIPSTSGMDRVMAKARLKLKALVFDSMEDSALMSESYRLGIPMVAAKKPTRSKRRRYRKLAEDLNRHGEGDLAAFFMEAD